jgi:uncharacterized protein (TIGR00252 family)
MTTFTKGRRAEAVAAEYLVQQSYQILQQNWRIRYCEIDIVASKAGTVHFVEVKYRASSEYGTGLEYITPTKFRRMSFAAQLWIKQTGWSGDYVLSAIALSGQAVVVDEFIEALV